MAMILSGVLMLRHLGEMEAANRLEAAIADVIAEGKSVTYDMKPTRDDPTAVGTSEVADAIIDKLGVRAYASEGRPSIGAGAVGATAAQELAARDYADVVLVDIIENLPQGKALDINQAGPILGYEPAVVGTNGYEETAGSDVVVITSGKPRSPGMSRDDLVTTNQSIVKSVTEQVVAHSPDAILIVVTNPLDAMCHVAKDVSGFPKERVFGQAGILDSARVPHLHLVGDRRIRQGRERDGARRPRRSDGLGRLRHDGRRRADSQAGRRPAARRARPAHRGRRR